MFAATVTNISALRSAQTPTLSSSPLVHVQGFAAAGDGGGGDFVWDTSGTYLLDDNIGIVITSGIDAGGRWRRAGFIHGYNSVPQDVNFANQGVNVKWFGAKGDGYTDDSAAIQNAVSAAGQIAQNMASNTSIGILGGYYPSMAVIIPDGVYRLTGSVNVNTGVDASGATLVGVGHPVLLSTDNTLNLVRVGAFSQLRNLTFQGGLHHVAMYGYNMHTGAIYDPTEFGNVPIVIDGCYFAYPKGPAIWQDTGPTAAIASGSNSVSLPAATINVGSTAFFPASGSFTVALQNGSYQTITYTGKTTTTFTGCTGGAGTLHTSDWIVIPTCWRSFQSTLRVTNFSFAGAHLYWGCGDSTIWSTGHIEFDQTTTQLSGDGMALGIWNSSDTMYVSQVTAFGSGSQPPRQAMVVGCGAMKFSQVSFAQNDFLTLVRCRVHANTYPSAAGINITLPYGDPAPCSIDLDIDHSSLVCVFGAWLLECYEAFPVAVKVRNWEDLDFENCLGIWLNSSVDLVGPLGNHAARQMLQFDGFQDWASYFRIYQGFDPGPTAQYSDFVTTEVTDVFRLYYVKEDKPGDAAFQENIFPTATADCNSGFSQPFALTAGSSVADTSSGYSVNLFSTVYPIQPVASFGPVVGTAWMPANSPAGIYCLSFYWKSNFGAPLWFSIAPNPNPGVTNAVRKVEASDSWQRVWVPFYYPGNNASWEFTMTCYLPANAWPVVARATSSAYQRLQRVTNGGNVYQSLSAATVAVGSDSQSLPQATINVSSTTFFPASGKIQVTSTAGLQTITYTGKTTTTFTGCTGGAGTLHTGQAVVGISGAGGGPSGTTGSQVDGGILWDYVGVGGTFTPSCAMGLPMLNKGRFPGPYVYPLNNDSATKFGFVKRTYYGTAAPTTGAYVVGDQLINVTPTAGGNIGWVCTASGSPGTWKSFGAIAS